jgi:hypothetical protein
MKATSILASLALVAGLAGSAEAITVANGDLVLGFYAGSGTGSSSCLEVNLGSASLYTNPSSSSWTIGNLSTTDLVNTYGTDWSSNSTLSWGIVGHNGKNTPTGATAYVSAPQTTTGTQSTAFPTLSTTALGVLRSRVLPMYDTTGNSMSNLTAESNEFSCVADKGTAGSFYYQQWSPGGTKLSVSFDLFNPTINSSVVPETGDYSQLDLYKRTNGAISYVGTFRLTTDGVLSFATSPVPEPSTYAAMMGLALGGFVLVRRRARKA